MTAVETLLATSMSAASRSLGSSILPAET